MDFKCDKGKIKFNPTAVIGCFSFVVSLLLVLVSIGMQNWASLSISRGSSGNGSDTSYTFKTQGPIQRCVSYVLQSNRFRYQDDSLKPKNSCVYLTELDCSQISVALASAHVVPSANELFNNHDEASCTEMKARLNASFAFVILGIIGTVACIILTIPIYPDVVYMAAGFCGIITALILAIAAWIFGDAERSFSGFFSRNGEPFDGCLSHGFGLAIAAMAVDIFGSVVSFSALCSSKFWEACKESKVFKKND